MAGNSFPLLQLPENVLKNVLTLINFLDLVSFSFCSKVAKQHVKSLNFKANFWTLAISRPYKFQFDVPPSNIVIEFVVNEGGQTCQPDFLRMQCNLLREERILRNRGYSFQYLMKHFLSLLNETSIRQIRLELDKLDCNTPKTLQGLTWRKLRISGLMTDPDMAINWTGLLPSKQLIVHSPFHSSDEFLMANLEILTVFVSYNMTLDHLLKLNSEYASFSKSRLTGKTLNKFLKLWIVGSCPRLKYIKILNEEVQLKEKEVMKGIKCKKRRRNVRRRIEIPFDIDYHTIETIEGGFDIEKSDRTTKATVLLSSLIFELIVLP